jgi:hypothetical protein
MVAEVIAGFAEGCADSGQLLSIGAHCFAVGMSVARYNDKPRHKSILEALAKGTQIGAFAATEADAGSDAMAIATSFEANGDGYLLNGTKHFISNAPVADVFLVLATRDPKLHFRGISAFLVPRETAGLSVTEEPAWSGCKRCPMGTVYLQDVQLPADAMLAEMNRGWHVFRDAMRCERAMMAGFFVGLMRRQRKLCIEHAQTHFRFGAPIGAYQHVAGRIVDMDRAEVTSELLFAKACELLYRGELTDRVAALAKLHASESLLETSLTLVRTMGASAFVGPNSNADGIIDAANGLVYSGTNDIQKVIIASALGLDT